MPYLHITKDIMPPNTQRSFLIQALAEPDKLWDIIVIGGGATGLGAALDAASRGYTTLLLEQSDFAKGTSSRSTKLVHGGVRYLAEGDVGLVREALYERGLLRKNAAHLVRDTAFIIPNYDWWGGPFYSIGLTLYDVLAGRLSFGRSRHISRKETLSRLPTLKEKGLRGGVVYYDGQFDDARLAVNLAQTALAQGAVLLNYFRVTGFTKTGGKITGLTARDEETGADYTLKTKVVINATGVFADELAQLDEPDKKPLIRPSQGVHIVLDKSFLPGADAIMIPKTEDGRVLFLLPWHEQVVIGTTDTPLNEHSLEPRALTTEIDFILRTAAQYLTKPPTRADVLSIYAGLRPLAAPQAGSTKTKEISRSHKIIVSASGLVTITGGKWTTYRRMAQDVVDKALKIAKLFPNPSRTRHLAIQGAQIGMDFSDHLYVYGSDREALLALLDENPAWAQKLHPRTPFIQAEVIWAVRQELALTVDDVLARRVRMLFLDARAAMDAAPEVAGLMAKELQQDEVWVANQVATFRAIASGYLLEAYIPIDTVKKI